MKKTKRDIAEYLGWVEFAVIMDIAPYKPVEIPRINWNIIRCPHCGSEKILCGDDPDKVLDLIIRCGNKECGHFKEIIGEVDRKSDSVIYNPKKIPGLWSDEEISKYEEKIKEKYKIKERIPYTWKLGELTEEEILVLKESEEDLYKMIEGKEYDPGEFGMFDGGADL